MTSTTFDTTTDRYVEGKVMVGSRAMIALLPKPETSSALMAYENRGVSITCGGQRIVVSERWLMEFLHSGGALEDFIRFKSRGSPLDSVVRAKVIAAIPVYPGFVGGVGPYL